MSFEYRLIRKSGWLLFNSRFPTKKYWASVQAACQGGGGMYAQISHEEFEAVWAENMKPNELQSHFNRNWNKAGEQLTADEHKLYDVIKLHNLAQYAHGDDTVRSVITSDENNAG